ncbi:MAG: amino acid adenylation domain-containing protein [Microcoleaceae cyanobacterium]
MTIKTREKTIDEFLTELRQLDVKLWVEGDRLRYRAAKGTLTPILLNELRERKTQILTFLKAASNSVESNLPPIVPVARNGNIPLSFAQQRFWSLSKLEPNSPGYNMAMAYRLKGSLNISVLEQSLKEIIQRHEILRTTFPSVDGQPIQAIASEIPLPLTIVDLQELPADERETEAQQLATEEARQPFNLFQGPLLRFKLFRLAPEEHILIWNLHCIICDGTSLDIFFGEFIALYKSFIVGKPSPLTELPIQYADFAHWQQQWLQSEAIESQLDYWKQQLDGNLPVIQLPSDRIPSPIPSHNGDRCYHLLPKSLSKSLNELSQKLGVTLFMTLLTAFKILLHRYSGQEDILISIASGGRGQVETEKLVGYLRNTLMLRTEISGSPSFRELLSQVRDKALGAYAHQDLPFEQIIEELKPEQSRSRSSLFQVAFSLNPPWTGNQGMSTQELPGLTVSSLFGYVYIGITKFDLNLVMRETDLGLRTVFEYNSDLFDSATIMRTIGHLQTLLESIVANPDRPISELSFLTDIEQRQFLKDLNDTQTNYPKDACIHKLFEAQVKQTPDATALICDREQLTYGELNARANQLAHYLQSQGVTSETLVGIYLESSIENVVGLLGILKAGAAYLPIDSTIEKNALTFILEDAKVSVLLTQESLLEKLPEHKVSVVCLDTATKTIALKSKENSNSQITPNNLAYVMYETDIRKSIKGVRVAHQAVVSLVKDVEYAHLSPEEVFLQVASISCDVSTFEIWGCLLNGGRLILSSSPTPSLQELGKTIQQYKITTLCLPVRLFHRFVDEQLDTLTSVRQLLTGGDVLSVPHVQKFLEKLGDCKLINYYSLTENTGLTCCYPISDPTQINSVVPIGKPIANTKVYLLDNHQQPVPVGVTGELYIGGDRLSQGYYHHHDLNDENFILSSFQHSKLYKTGDLARYLPDGNLEFLGRAEERVKIRDLWVELPKIETILSQYPAVGESVVIDRDDLESDKCLVAYIVPKQQQAIAISELRNFLRQKLSSYMMPSAFVLLNALPLKPNGTLDYSLLPAPNTLNQEAEETVVVPRDDLDVQLIKIWEKVFGINSIGIKDNFFDLGGHSMLAVQIFAEIEKTFNKKLPLSTLLQAPTIEQLANLLQSEGFSGPQEWVVPLKKGSDRSPLFCIYGILLYNALAYHLDQKQSVYGVYLQEEVDLLVAGEVKQNTSILTNVEQIASLYLKQIRKIQPVGPYFLLGESFGGLVVFEMAQQLQEQGEKVELLALLDTLAPKKSRKLPLYKRIPLHLSNFVNDPTYLFEKVREKVESAKDKLVPIVRRIYPQFASDRQQLAQKDLRGDVRSEAMKNYVPRSYSGKMVLFRAMDKDEFKFHQIDPLHGWGEVATGGLEIIDVPGDHIGILKEPNVRVLAEKLQTYL